MGGSAEVEGAGDDQDERLDEEEGDLDVEHDGVFVSDVSDSEP